MHEKFTLYGRANSGSLVVQIVLEEIGAPYEMHWVGHGEADLAALRAVNPAGRVPALRLPDGTAVAESAAILIYLASAFPAARLAPPPGSSAHARFLEAMVSLSANLYDTALRYYYAARYSSAGEAAAAGIRAQAGAAYTALIEAQAQRLAPYVLGASYSAADPYFYMLSGWHEEAAALRARLAPLARHAELVRARAATARAEAANAAQERAGGG